MSRSNRFLLLVLLLVVFAAVRSLMATRNDDFTIDEPYHINSGVAYVTRGDFRLNPEHPPLVKLWTGAFVAPMYKLPPFRTLDGKLDERDFHESAVFLGNDPVAVQRRARVAMIAFHMLALAALAFAIRRILGDAVALGALLFLVIDPTVAAHMPVVMTDLPVALLSAIALFTAIAAFRSWRPLDLAIASLTLGLAIGAKHSAIVTAIAVAILAIVMALRSDRRVLRLALAATVLVGAMLVLWAQYGFRYAPSRGGAETFNHPLASKITDLHTPMYRRVVTIAADAHLLPRAYLWGLADVLRAGVEGRAYPFTQFGRTYIGFTPWYYFPAAIAVKLPVALLILTLAGIAIALRTRIPIGPVLLLGALFLAALMTSNSGYAGVRHALPLFPVAAVFAGIALAFAYEHGRATRALAATAVVIAAVVAVPRLRPWEFFNTIAGGRSAYLRFSDEGSDLGQRTRDIAAYYRAHIASSGLPVFDDYGILDRQRERLRLRTIGYFDELPGTGPLQGWFFVRADNLANQSPWVDYSAFRQAHPVARVGSVLVYRGTFNLPWLRALHNELAGVMMLIGPKPDVTHAQPLIEEAVRLNPSAYPIRITLANIYAKQGRRNDAITTFMAARARACSVETRWSRRSITTWRACDVKRRSACRR